MKTNTIIIEKMINGGYGLAREDSGRVILLRNALPTEQLQYSITQRRKGTLFGYAEKIIHQHDGRIIPPCPYYGDCGGCDLQHADYDLQLQIKHYILKELFSNYTDLIQQLIPSPQEFGYRQRIRLQIKDGKIGFLRFRSADIVPISSCLLAHPHINSVLDDALQLIEFKKLCKLSTEVELLVNPATEKITIVFHLKRKPRPTDNTLAEMLTLDIDLLASIFFAGKEFALIGPLTDKSKTPASIMLSQEIHSSDLQESVSLAWEIGGFCQVNLEQNCNLIDFVRQNCDWSKEKRLLDLYCGMGNFSIPLAKRFKCITGVEGQGASIRCAKLNSIREKLANTTYVKGSIHDVCKGFVHAQKKFDVTLIDPPRQGIPGLPHMLDSLTTNRLIYISCDPATLVRDTGKLLENNFTLKLVQPFDMFPQTHHIETAVIFEKN